MSVSCVKVEDSELVRNAALKDFVFANVDRSVQNELPFPRDFGFTPCFLPKKFERVSDFIWNFGVRADDVWIVTFPKAGTTWTSNIVWKLMNRLDYSLSYISPGRKHLDSAILFDETGDNKDDEKYKDYINEADLRMRSLENENSPRMIKSHLPAHLLPKEIWTVKPKLIYVYRNSKDVAISMYHMLHSFPYLNYQGSMEEFFELFLRDGVTYAPFHAHVNGFQKLQHHLDHILLISYDEMVNNSFREIKKISEFLGYKYTDDQLTQLNQHVSFDNMKDSSKYQHSLLNNMKFFRKGKSGGFRDEMSSDYITRFDEWETRNSN